MSEPRRILVVRLSALGDVLLATPAVRALKARYPQARIDWLTEKVYLPLIEANPHVRARAYDKHGAHKGSRGYLKLRDELEAEGYDLVVDLQDKPKTWLLRAAGQDTLAWHKRTPAESVQSLLGREKPRIGPHAVRQFLDVLAPLGVGGEDHRPELVLTDAMRAEADAAVPTPARVVGLAPGARWQTKRWPAAKFAEVGVALRSRGFTPLLVGGRGDAEDVEAIRAALGGAPDTMGLSVGGLAAAIARCSLLVTGDSGPAHIASALGTPVVAVFGPTSPDRWRPVGAQVAVVSRNLACSPCSNHGSTRCPLGHHACLAELPAGAVLSAIDALGFR